MVTIVQKNNKILRQKAKPVSAKDFGTIAFKKVVRDMKKALGGEPDGVAIAAPQIGAPLRMFLVSNKVFVSGEAPGDSKVISKDKLFVNPEIIKRSREKDFMEEGCLSVRYLYGRVSRSKKIRVRAFDEKGHKFELGGSGLLAQIFQHETDHLDGVLFTDKAKDVVELTPEKHAKQNK